MAPMTAPLPLTRDLVLIGGGHAHALVARAWGMAPVPGVRLTLINPGPTAPYSGMLPGLIAGHYTRAQLEIDLVPLAAHAGARLVIGRAEGIDRAARLIHVPGRPPIRYDLASIDIGITSDLPDLPGFAAHAVPAKPLGAFAEAWERFVARAWAGEVAPLVAVIGAGVAGVELALAARHRLAQAGLVPQVTLIDAAPDVLRDVRPGARAALMDQIAGQGVHLRTGAPVARITAEGVVLQGGDTIPAALVIGAAGARPQGWLAGTGLDLTDGFVTVDRFLRSITDPAIFAVGDCAHLAHAPRPKAGVYAVRQAPVLLANLRAAATGGRPGPYHPQKDYLKLISMGGKRAAADRLDARIEGGWVWRWKDHIDRKFMRRFHHLPPMGQPPRIPRGAALGVADLVGGQPPCGGCAAKPGAAALAQALADLAPPARPDVLRGAGDDAAILAHGAGAQVFTTDHLRAVTEDPHVMARIAATHALGDIWAMSASPQAALATVILPRMAEPMQAATLREILAGAQEVLRAAGADLAGGHSSTGAELTIGFALTGLVAGRPLGLDGAQPGDALILTKPLGSGTILAAAMQGKATGPELLAALEMMQQGQGQAAARLAALAHAMTDVTGYGLVGHLLSMLRASGVGAALDLDALPLMAGALRLSALGIRSTLYPQNAALASGIEGADPADPRTALLFDPQTAGGLLAALPEAAAAGLLDALGAGAARIGTVTAGAPRISLG
ncbi:selenide, water dikinase SelD [Rhodovulum tesquicola]|uniref:selenide, water dikinase SelD n=1 Tax=Rhodovulum tesquicola TaxID=540254 RepID=UPI002097C8F0|nr:selenide, water dikinase SelD [Rhodovulum tesquicola]MCO8146546.1 selenide, water dikinase SelD [Rhodovulum tesquicola]